LDKHLKAAFHDVKAFTPHTVIGVEKRLGAKIEKLHRDVTAGFQVVDAKLTRMDRDGSELKRDLGEVRRDLKTLVGSSGRRPRR